MKEHPARVKIDRNVRYYEAGTLGFTERLKWVSLSGFSCACDFKKLVKKVIPSIEWLSTYKWREWLLRDVIAGITIAIMNIPQGMVSALLAKLPPIVGIYTAFFPVLVYVFLGTSRHVAMGSFAVISLMIGNIVWQYSNVDKSSSSTLTPIQVATSVTFFVAIFQLVLFCVRFGALCTLLSETLITGFTSAAAVHVVTSQIMDMLGIEVKTTQGYFSLIFTYVEILSKIPSSNVAAVIGSLITFAILILNTRIFKPFIRKRTQFPIPIELLLIILGAMASHFGRVHETYSLTIVGDIPKGLPNPKTIYFALFPKIAVMSFIIALISYVVTQSMALILANQMKYKIDANQELLAQGCANLLGSFFSCMPTTASFSRSAVQVALGSRSQLSSLVCAMCLLVVLLWIAPLFMCLPRCLLASLVVYSLRTMVFKVTDLIRLTKVSKPETLIFLSVYLTVIIINIEIGLFCGVAMSLIVLITRVIIVDLYVLERVPFTEIYLKSDSSETTERIPGVTILHYEGTINFINKELFMNKVIAAIRRSEETEGHKGAVILDLSSVNYVDRSGAIAMKVILTDFNDRNILFVGVHESVLSILRVNEELEMISRLFPTVHDAVVCYEHESKKLAHQPRKI